MWNRNHPDRPRIGSATISPAADRSSAPAAGMGRHELATIGPAITIVGEVTGDEDLVIRGRVEGSVVLDAHHVTVGAEGRVKADISARTVTVEGQVEGDLRGAEQVVLRRTARVTGNIVTPRIELEDGASFRGGIEMDDVVPQRAKKAERPAAAATAATGPSSKLVPGESAKE